MRLAGVLVPLNTRSRIRSWSDLSSRATRRVDHRIKSAFDCDSAPAFVRNSATFCRLPTRQL